MAKSGWIGKETLMPCGVVAVLVVGALGVGTQMGTDSTALKQAQDDAKSAKVATESHGHLPSHQGTAITLSFLREQAEEQKAATRELDKKVDGVRDVVKRIEAKLDK